MDRWESLREHIQRTYRVTVDDRIDFPSMNWNGLRFIADPSGSDASYVHAETRTGRGHEYVVVIAGLPRVNELNFVEMTQFVSTKLLERVITSYDGDAFVQESVPIDQVDAAVLDSMIENVLTLARVLKLSYLRT